MCLRNHSGRGDILDQGAGWFFFFHVYNKYFTFYEKKFLGRRNMLACVNFSIDYFKALFVNLITY